MGGRVLPATRRGTEAPRRRGRARAPGPLPLRRRPRASACRGPSRRRAGRRPRCPGTTTAPPASRTMSWPAAASTERIGRRRQQRVEARARDEAERQRDRPDHPQPMRRSCAARASATRHEPRVRRTRLRGSRRGRVLLEQRQPLVVRGRRPRRWSAHHSSPEREVVDVAERDVAHVSPVGDGDRQAVERHAALGVQRPVDRVDHHLQRAAAVDRDRAALLRDARTAATPNASSSANTASSTARVDGQRHVAALAAAQVPRPLARSSGSARAPCAPGLGRTAARAPANRRSLRVACVRMPSGGVS